MIITSSQNHQKAAQQKSNRKCNPREFLASKNCKRLDTKKVEFMSSQLLPPGMHLNIKCEVSHKIVCQVGDDSCQNGILATFNRLMMVFQFSTD